MPKLTKDIYGVVSGEVYPRTISAGEDCPPELKAAALDAGALEAVDETAKKPDPKAKKPEGQGGVNAVATPAGAVT